MAMIFFQVGLTDLTPAVDVQHYDVNVNDVYTAWTDANWIEHRDKVRTRIEGRIILGYSNAASFAAAVTTIATALSANGYAACTVRTNNDGTTHSGDFFLEIQGTGRWDELNSRQWQTLEIEIRER